MTNIVYYILSLSYIFYLFISLSLSLTPYLFVSLSMVFSIRLSIHIFLCKMAVRENCSGAHFSRYGLHVTKTMPSLWSLQYSGTSENHAQPSTLKTRRGEKWGEKGENDSTHTKQQLNTTNQILSILLSKLHLFQRFFFPSRSKCFEWVFCSGITTSQFHKA